MILQTERLILRKFTKDDLPELAPLLADPEVMRFSLKGPLSYKEAGEYLESRILSNYDKYGFSFWAVISKEDGRLIGLMGLIMQTIDGEDLVELAYRLEPKHWGKGLATEAVTAIRDYAFDKLQLKRLISIIDPKNVRSIAVAKHIGMQFWKEAVFHGLHIGVYTKTRACP